MKRISPPILNTKRLTLDPWRTGQIEEYCEIFCDPKVAEFAFRNLPTDRVSSERRFQNLQNLIPGSYYGWAAYSGDKLLGSLELGQSPYFDTFEIRAYLLPHALGKHFSTEGLRAIVRFAFDELQLPEVCAVVNLKNFNGCLLVHHLGFTPEVVLKDDALVWLWTLKRRSS